MAGCTLSQLPGDLLEELRSGAAASLLTLGRDGYPYAVFTWVVGRSRSSLCIAVDRGSTSESNLDHCKRATVQIVSGDGGVFLIRGRAHLEIEQLASARPLEIAMYVLTVESVRDQSWAVAGVAPIQYFWMEERRDELEALEAAVLAEMGAAR